jgi:hypothetical protein
MNHLLDLDLDLDLEHYQLPELLALFQVSLPLLEADLRRAKMRVLKTHPDKSGLPADVFRFFSRAYKVLFSLYEFQTRRQERAPVSSTTERAPAPETEESFRARHMNESTAAFQAWFNKEFEKQRMHDERTDTGYGDWLVSEEDVLATPAVATPAAMAAVIEERKQVLSRQQALVVREDLDMTAGSRLTFGTLAAAAPAEFSSDLFASLAYEDLKKAHQESVVPVCQEDFVNRQRFRSVQELEMFRQGQQRDVVPLSEAQSLQYLQKKQAMAEQESTLTAFQLAREMEVREARQRRV